MLICELRIDRLTLERKGRELDVLVTGKRQHVFVRDERRYDVRELDKNPDFGTREARAVVDR